MKHQKRTQFSISNVVCVLAAIISAAPFLQAQSTSGDLLGTVVDPAGAAVPGAQVEATNENTGVRTTATSESKGEYRFSNLPIGKYELEISAGGFAKKTLKGVAIELNKTVTQNVTLAIGQVSSTVEVTDAAVAIDTTTAQIQTNFNAKLTADLPAASLATGGVLNLSLLSAGVTNAGGVGMGEGPSVGGQRPDNNNFTIEGIDNNEKSTTGALMYVPNDAVGEFTLLQNQFSPEFGHSSGGQFNTGIKSGGNQFNGEIYEYFLNRNLNAVDQTNANQGIRSNPRFDQNRLGANFGGPIKKDKLFFFADFEYNPTGQASSPSSPLLAPTAAGYATLAALPGVNNTNLQILQKYVPAAPAQSSTIPLQSAYTSGPYTRVPAINIPVGVFAVSAPNFQNAYYGVASVDYSLSQKDQLRGRYLYNRVDTIDTASVLPQFFDLQPTRVYLTTLSEYHNFAPTLNNELRLGYLRFNQSFPVPNLKFPGLDAFPNLVFGDLNGLPIGPDSQAPQYTIQNTYQLTDNLTWLKGAHTLKFGFDGRKYISPQTFTQRSRGDYEYQFLGDYLYDNLPDSVAQRSLGNPVYYGDQTALNFYGNDEWKLSPHFTLDLGLRYEFISVPFSERSQAVNNYASVPGLITFSKPEPQYTNFAPRVGIAYSPGESGKTSIRAGWGINYDVIKDNIGILDLPPQLSTTVDLDSNNILNLTRNFLASGAIPPSSSTGQLSVAEARAKTSAYIPNQKLPYSIQWNFGIQHEFAGNYTFEVRYLGTRGVHLDVQDRINKQSPVTAANALPTFFSQPTAAQIASLTNTLAAIPTSNTLPAFAAAGFNSTVLENAPIGNSVYHGLAMQLSRRFNHGLMLNGAYTWSHNIDDSTADFFTTVLTPRRPQDFQNLRADRSSSALDRRQRLVLYAVWDAPFYKSRQNWFLKNLIGNWELAPVYTYESPEYATVQSQLDSNLNGDSWGDRVVVNSRATSDTGTGVTALTNAAGNIVGYVANDPNAKYVVAGKGTIATGGRNTLPMRPIDNIDLTLVKRFSITERVKFEFQGQFSNALNHPQFTGGYVNHVDAGNPTLVAIEQGGGVRNMLTPGNPIFNRPDQVFSSNPRQAALVAKFTF